MKRRGGVTSAHIRQVLNLCKSFDNFCRKSAEKETALHPVIRRSIKSSGLLPNIDEGQLQNTVVDRTFEGI